jgi:4'-phosphopantetheinyl transferase
MSAAIDHSREDLSLTSALGEPDVHVWRIALDALESRWHVLQRLLSPDELRRAARYRFDEDRRRFVAARASLRIILSRYLNVTPERVSFRYDSYGKPSLDAPLDAPRLRFNLAHSGALALCAVTRAREVGIDVERIRSDFAIDRVAQAFFSPGENSTLGALPKALRHEAFFKCWTRKEAYLKAKGQGLSLALDRFEVTLAPGEAASLKCTLDDPEEATRWRLRDVSPHPDYAAALAIEGAHKEAGPLGYFDAPT